MTHGLSVATQGLVHLYRSEGHDVAALAGVDLSVNAGEMVGLLGPSGAGKSTLLSLLAGLFPPSAGKVTIGGADLTKHSIKELEHLRRSDVALMLQGAMRNLLPYLSPSENVVFAQLAARRRGEVLADPKEVLEAMGVDSYAKTALSSMAPGHQQLTALAVAISTRPGLLLADEPTSQLDHKARDVVLETLVRVNTELGTTVVLVTHDPEVAHRLPRTVTIRDGRIGGEGRAGEEFAVVNTDGFLPLPAHVLADLPPGTLLRLHRDEIGYRLLPQSDGGGTP